MFYRVFHIQFGALFLFFLSPFHCSVHVFLFSLHFLLPYLYFLLISVISLRNDCLLYLLVCLSLSAVAFTLSEHVTCQAPGKHMHTHVPYSCTPCCLRDQGDSSRTIDHALHAPDKHAQCCYSYINTEIYLHARTYKVYVHKHEC